MWVKAKGDKLVNLSRMSTIYVREILDAYEVWADDTEEGHSLASFRTLAQAQDHLNVLETLLKDESRTHPA